MMDVPSVVLPVQLLSANKQSGANEPSGRNGDILPSQQYSATDATSSQSHPSVRLNHDGGSLSDDNDMPGVCSNKQRKDDGSVPRRPAPKRALPPRPRMKRRIQESVTAKTKAKRALPPMRSDNWATFPHPACSSVIHPRSALKKGSVASIEKPVNKRLFTCAATAGEDKIEQDHTETSTSKGSMTLPEKPASKHLFTNAVAADGYSKIKGLTDARHTTEHSPWRK